MTLGHDPDPTDLALVFDDAQRILDDAENDHRNQQIIAASRRKPRRRDQRLCRCGHPRLHHTHHRTGTDCSRVGCGCPHYDTNDAWILIPLAGACLVAWAAVAWAIIR